MKEQPRGPLKAVLAAAAIALCSCPSVSVAQAQNFAASAAVGGIIDQLRSAAGDIIHNGELAVTRGSFEVKQNAEILSQQLALIAESLRGKTFADLNDTQRQFFNNTWATLQEWRAGVNHTASKADEVVARADSLLGTLPGADRTARVVGYSPRYLSASALNAPVRVNVKGSWLGSGEPALSIGGKSCSRATKNESSLEFVCQLSAASPASQVTLAKAKLVVEDRKGWWDRILGLFGDNTVQRSYDLGLFLVPQRLGTFSAVAVTEAEQEITQEKVEERRADNEHCQGTRRYAWTLNATPGWAIVSQPAVDKLSDGDATNEGVQGWTASSFTITGKAKNSGECVKVLGQTVAYDGRGHVMLRSRWTESRKETREASVPVAIGAIDWGAEQVVALPPRTKSITIKAEQIDGQKLIDTATALRKWYRVEVDTAASRVVIRPKQLDEALIE